MDNFEAYKTATFIADKRCTKCFEKEVLDAIKKQPEFIGTDIIELDYSDPKAEEIISDNNIKTLPIIMVSHNNVKAETKQYLTKLKNNNYFLVLGEYNPTLTLSDRWLAIMDKDIYDKTIKANHIEWSKDAEITWIEFSDLNCHFCKKMAKDWTANNVIAAIGETKINKAILGSVFNDMKRACLYNLEVHNECGYTLSMPRGDVGLIQSLQHWCPSHPIFYWWGE